MEIKFYKTKQEVRSVKETITLGEFYKLLLTHKPSEIFNAHYSREKPCYYITEYINANTVKYYVDAWGYKTPRKITIEKLYGDLLIEGLDSCFFYIEQDQDQDYGQGKTQQQYEYSMKATMFAMVAIVVLVLGYLVFKFIGG